MDAWGWFVMWQIIMPNFITRIFAYPILERELLNRLADRDKQIVSQQVELQELRDRLYIRHGFVPSGQSVDIGKPAYIPAYRTGRQRLKDMVKPGVTSESLTAEEEKQIQDSMTQ